MHKITLDTAFRHYNDHCKSSGRRERSLEINMYAQRFLKEYLEHNAISDDVLFLERFIIRSFLLWLQEEKDLSASSAQRIYDVMSAMFNFLADEELVERNPMKKVEKPRRESSC